MTEGKLLDPEDLLINLGPDEADYDPKREAVLKKLAEHNQAANERSVALLRKPDRGEDK